MFSTSSADQQDVGFGELDVVRLLRVVQPLVVVVDRNREDLLRVPLTDHIIVKDFPDLERCRDTVPRLHQRGFVLLADDIHAQLNAFIADEHGRAGDELANLVLALAAERAVGRIDAVLAAAA